MKPEKSEHDYLSHYVDEMDFINASSATECTGLIPSAPLSQDEVDAYEDIWNFSPKQAVCDECSKKQAKMNYNNNCNCKCHTTN